MIRLTLIGLLISFGISAQYIQNPSFEGVSTCVGGCNGNSFPPWEICNFSPDLRGNMNSCFNFDAPDSTHYLALFSAAGNFERLGQEMLNPIIKDKKYIFSGYFRDFRKTCYASTFDTSKLILQVFMSNVSCGLDSLVLEIEIDSTENFQLVEKSFEVNQTYQYITFATRNKAGGLGNKYCLIDLVGIKEDDFTSLSGKPDVKKAQKQIIIEAR